VRVLPIIWIASYEHRLVKLVMLHVVANSKTEKQDSCFQGRGQELSCPAALMNQFMSLIVNDLKARSEEGQYHPLALHQHHLPSEIIQQTSVKRQASTHINSRA